MPLALADLLNLQGELSPGAARECPGARLSLPLARENQAEAFWPGCHGLSSGVLSFSKLPLGMSPAFLSVTFLFTWPFCPAGRGGRNRPGFPGTNYGKGGLS